MVIDANATDVEATLVDILSGLTQAISILTIFALLGTGRVGTCIVWLALQGILIGSIPALLLDTPLNWHMGLLVAANVALKGFLFPWMLQRLRGIRGFHNGVESFVGFVGSVLFGIAALAFSIWLANYINTGLSGRSFAALDMAVFMILNGLFLMITRRKAVMQVLGYLVLENGIFVFGLSTVATIPLLVELGVLLDAFVAVFVMGMAVYRINREFSDIDIDKLDSLRG